MSAQIVFNTQTRRYTCNSCHITMFKKSITQHAHLHKMYDGDATIRKHFDIDHDNFKCVDCGYVTFYLFTTEHMKMHTDCPTFCRIVVSTENKRQTCHYRCLLDKCSSDVMTLDDTMRHNEIHANCPSELFTCALSGYHCLKCETKISFSHQEAIEHEKKHIKYAHYYEIDGMRFICKTCGSICDNAEKHILAHIVCRGIFSKFPNGYTCDTHKVFGMTPAVGYEHYMTHHFKVIPTHEYICQPQFIKDECSWCHTQIMPTSHIMFMNHLATSKCKAEWQMYDYHTTRYCLSVFVAGFYDKTNEESPLVHMSKDVMERIVKHTVNAPM